MIFKNVRYVIMATFFKKRRLMQLQYQKVKEMVRGYVHFFHRLIVFLLLCRLVHRLNYVIFIRFL